LIPTRTDLTAPKLTILFFNEWYCENGLPLELISDRDKLFVSKFWKALHKLTGVHLKLSTAYHPQTDGASERTNKTLNQCIRFHVEHNQKGWVRALPLIRFNIMNSVNASMGFSGFQLQMGWTPRVIPPIVPTSVSDLPDEEILARSVISQLEIDSSEAKDNLLASKVSQAFHANKGRGAEDTYAVGDKVMLSTLHRRKEYKAGNKNRVAKFFPRWDGPFGPPYLSDMSTTTVTSSPPANTLDPVRSLPQMESKSTRSKGSSMNVKWVGDINIWFVGLVTPRPMTCGSLDANLKRVLRWTIGWLVRQRERGSFFPLGFLMHPSFLVDVVLN
jgi:transposase InsO family protein